MKEDTNLLDEEEFNNLIIKKRKNTKKFKIFIISFSLLLLLGIALTVLIIFNFNFEKKEMTNLIRLKNWEFCSSNDISLSAEDISLGKESKNFTKAPEDFYVCTAMGGISGHKNDFFFGTNLKNVSKEKFDCDWWFRSNFILKNISKENLILLHINGINYKSDIYLDGQRVAGQDEIIGTFVKFTLDITSFINTNTDIHYIAFKIKRPKNQWGSEGKYDTDLAISFVDWNPEAPDSNMGIWQPVDIEVIPYKIPIISNAFVITNLINDNFSNLNIIFNIKNWEDFNIENINISIQIGDFVNFKLENISIENKTEKQISTEEKEINNSELWWPYQMGEPKLHPLIITITKGDKYYIYQRKIGLRQIKSELDSNKNRIYKINNKAIFLKGAGWTPDLFLRQSPETYRKHISYVRDMELNVIRLEGKSEGEEFYDYCDKLGILVISGWNCGDAWQRWENWTKEVEEIGNKSVKSQIRKLSTHPSVIIFILGSDLGPKNGIEPKWRKIFKEEKWPNEILSSASNNTEEVEPTGVKMTGPYSWVPPNYFYLEKSKNNEFGGAWGFLTEGGTGENPLRNGSYEKVFGETNINYEGEIWNYHCGNKGVFGDLSKLINPIKKRYGNIIDFNDFQKKSGAAVYEGHRAMFEAYSCNKYNSTGVIQWMLNNAWPSNIWHLYDYFFAPTPAYFAAKKAGERIHILYNYNDSYIYVLNNYLYDFKNEIDLNIFIIENDGQSIAYNNSRKIDFIEGDGVKKVEELIFNNIFNIVHLEYSYKYKEKNYYYTNTYWLNKDMDIIDYKNYTFYNVNISHYANLTFLQELPLTNLSIENIEEIFIKDEINKKKISFKIKNTGNSFALLLEMKLYEKSKDNGKKEIITPIFWNDNYFSIRKGKSYNVEVEFYDNGNNSREIYLDIFGWNCQYYGRLP